MSSLMKSEKISARVHEWQEDALAAAAVNAAIEGADASMATLSATTMRTNNTQIFTKAFQVSNTVDAIAHYGRGKETAYQLAKALKEIKRDIERALVGVSQAAVVGSASAARKMASVSAQISNSTDAGSNSTDALTEAKLLVGLQAAYTAGSDIEIGMLKPADAQIVAGFAAASGRNREFASTKTLVNVIDLYVN